MQESQAEPAVAGVKEPWPVMLKIGCLTTIFTNIHFSVKLHLVSMATNRAPDDRFVAGSVNTKKEEL